MPYTHYGREKTQFPARSEVILPILSARRQNTTSPHMICKAILGKRDEYFVAYLRVRNVAQLM